jgi:hypothetical protein
VNSPCTGWLFWSNGYEALRALDDNGDGELRGAELWKLAIWRGRNQNGVSEKGEVSPLTAHGIADPVPRTSPSRDLASVGHALQPGASACPLGPGIPDAPPTLIRQKPTGHCLPPGGRVIATPVLRGLHHEYQLGREAA